MIENTFPDDRAQLTDVEYIEKVLRFLCRGVVELRCLNTAKGTISGYFDDLHKAAAIAAQLNENVSAIYITLNPVDPRLLPRSLNRVKGYAKETTADKDILRRCWLPIDFDPVRPAGISSTDEEHAAALERAADCRIWLRHLGFPEGILADSGNGAHVLLPIDAPNSPDTAALISGCLKAIDAKFSDEVVATDLSVFNAARIWKLYGTRVCKGDSIPERPHRMARILEGGAEL
jgi:hypothetical protein